MNEPYEFYLKSADYVRARMPFQPELAVILGSSLGPFAAELRNRTEIAYADIPNFPRCTVADHAGKLIFGELAGKRLVCLSGRFHSYEGYDFEQLTQPVRLLKLLGVRAAILTNAAGGVNLSYRPGDVMVISDHIKLNGASPLRGQNVEDFGERFFDTTRMYTPELRALALRCAEGSGLRVHEGVYFFMPGPQFETPAEVRAARVLGADAVGMSTVPETIVAAHCGMEVMGVTLLANMAAGVLPQPLSGAEVNEAAEAAAPAFSEFLLSCLESL